MPQLVPAADIESLILAAKHKNRALELLGLTQAYDIDWPHAIIDLWDSWRRKLPDVAPPEEPDVTNYLQARRAVDLFLRRLENLRETTAAGPTLPSLNTGDEQTSPVARAVALMLEAQRDGKQVPKVKELARAVGCHRTTLYRDGTFKAALTAMRTGAKPPKGYKDREGNIDAENEDE